MHPPEPRVVSFLICDQIITERGTHKKSLIGVFHDLWAPAFPCVHPRMSIYSCLSDALGRYEFEVRLVEVNSQQVVGGGRIPPLEIQDKLAQVELALDLHHVGFPRAGKHEFQLCSGGRPIFSKAFMVRLIEAQPPAHAGTEVDPASPFEPGGD
ncbi:MAG: hypothetical protein HY722_17325 [Planctomycetes bacterium]|nr:hypothetical protein [Planctomycetota bacterium]